MTPIPFSKIALSLSGGGYRATTFHLGTMSLLNSLEYEDDNLLSRVSILSTISGGTLTGVMYALKIAEGGTYYDCFTKLYALLQEDKLVERALHKLNNPDKWTNKHKSRDVINAFAEVYDQYFYEGKTFAVLYEGKTGHLNDIIFGASEFTTGVQFRFQRAHEDELFGNGNLNLPKSASREIRLADAAASSSCFPGGFEPMVMPKDYGNGPGSAVEEAWNEMEHEPVTAIMDGGVLDNQGIEGVKLAEQRHLKDGLPLVGTYLISDVSGETMDPLEVPEFNYSSIGNFFTFRSINLIALLILAVAIGLLFVWDAPPWDIVLVSCLATLIAGWFALFFTVRKIVIQEVSKTFAGGQLPEIMKDFGVLTTTPIYILYYLAKFRALSVLKMVMDIFLRRIRQLQISALFASPEWRGRIKNNNIYSLKGAHVDVVGFKMSKVIAAANTMPTTLWFSEAEKEQHMLDDLIAAGQCTLCFNLRKYIDELKTKEYEGQNIWAATPPAQQASIEQLRSNLEDYWRRFREDPYWLLNEDKAGGEVNV
ncbi:patatin-like phospholipase family protein [Neolewinella persica]|uniref:patatin-like phospholipase family protein n=1 Tax=Neolewinella persica TaxID=70998 RepID=UPI00037184B8|nr:patatin-like phospholipase family protein [Neolewinella persica]